MSKWLKKRDVILIIALLLVGIITLVIWHFIYSTNGNMVKVEQRGNVIGTYSLDEDTEIPILYRKERVNLLVIEDGYCHMEEADCPDHLCIKQGKINKVGQTIVCMPNQVVVTVVGDDDSSLDSVAK